MGGLFAPSSIPPLTRIPRTNNQIITAADDGLFFDVTSGTFTQTTDTAAALGSGYQIWYRNSGTGIVTYTPGSGTIDGRASIRIYPGESFVIQCDGTNQNSLGRKRKGDLVLINETVIAVPVANVDFTLGFDDTELADMFFRVAGLVADSGTVRHRVSIAGTFQTSGYSRAGWQVDVNNTTNPASRYGTALTQATFCEAGAALASGAGEVELRDFASTTTAKEIFARSSAIDGSGNVYANSQFAALTGSTAALDGWRIFSNSGNITAVTIQQMGRRQ